MTTTRFIAPLIAAGLLAFSGSPALADSSRATATSTATSTSTTVVPLHFERKCPKSGTSTSTMDGSYTLARRDLAI